MISFILILFFWQTEFRQVPYSDDWRSAQPTLNELETFLRQQSVQCVIRMNSSDETPSTSIQAEQALCKKLGVKFFYINAHNGYIKDKGYLGSAKQINWIMNKYSCLIHCKHGYDRTGAMVGYYLTKRGVSPSNIISHNRWKNYLQIKGLSYSAYYETAINN